MNKNKKIEILKYKNVCQRETIEYLDKRVKYLESALIRVLIAKEKEERGE